MHKAVCRAAHGTYLLAVSQGHFQGCFLNTLHWSHCPAALQNFLEDMLDMLDDLGLKVPCQGLPPIIWHDPITYYPGETLVNAMHAGAGFFRAKPDIIFVCLPEKGRVHPMRLKAGNLLSQACFNKRLTKQLTAGAAYHLWGLWPGCAQLTELQYSGGMSC